MENGSEIYEIQKFIINLPSDHGNFFSVLLIAQLIINLSPPGKLFSA